MPGIVDFHLFYFGEEQQEISRRVLFVEFMFFEQVQDDIMPTPDVMSSSSCDYNLILRIYMIAKINKKIQMLAFVFFFIYLCNYVNT